MKLLELHVENFGALHDHTEVFTDGLNLCVRPNGWGKSTLAVFIKAMLYGLPASTKRSLIENERKRYTPWQGGAYGGSLDIEVEEKRYRIERFFGAKEAEDTLRVLSLATGEIADVAWAQCPGEGLFGVDAAAYERSTYLSQRPEDMLKEGTLGIQTKLTRLVDATDDLGNYDSAMEALERRRRTLRHLSGGGGEIAQGEERLFTLTRAIDAAFARRGALEACRDRIAQIKEETALAQKEVEGLREVERNALHRREYAAVRARVDALLQEQTEMEQALRKLRASLGEPIPTEAELDELDDVLRMRERAQNEYQRSAPDALAEAEETTLTACFALPLPDEKHSELLRHEAGEYHRAAVLATGKIEEMLSADIDTWALANEQKREALCHTLQLLEKTAQDEDVQTSRHVGRSMLCAAGAVIGALLMIGGIVFWPLLIAGILLATLCGGAYLIVRRVQLQTQAEQQQRESKLAQQLASLKEELAHCDRVAAAAECGKRFALLWQTTVDPVRLPLPDAAHAVMECERALSLARRLDALCTQREQQSNARHAAEKACSAADARVQRYLAGRVGLPPDVYAAARALRDGASRLRQGEELYEKKVEESRALQEQYRTLLTNPPASDTADEDMTPEQLGVLRREREERLTSLTRSLAQEVQNEQRLIGESEELAALEAEREEWTARIAEQKELLSTIEQTEKYLKQAKEQLSGRYLTTMQASFAHYMQLLGNDQLPSFTMDSRFRVKLRAGGVGRESEAFSVGMRDLIGFCERLSLLDAMFECERPFLILDDPFVNLDDATVERARELMRDLSERYQILYLSCSQSRAIFDHKIKNEDAI